jgi:hypothetical protein
MLPPKSRDTQANTCSAKGSFMPNTDYSRLKRKRYPMRQFVMDALVASKVREDYFSRPAYQQNDYIGWITRAKQEKTKQKRLAQMIDELKDGRLYMKMKYPL